MCTACLELCTAQELARDSEKGSQMENHFNSRKEAFRNPTSPIYLRELKSESQKDTNTPVFITALVTTQEAEDTETTSVSFNR